MPSPHTTRPLAVVTGASSGIGFELAKQCATNGFDLILAADEPLDAAVDACRQLGASVETVAVDLATIPGVDSLVDRIGGRPIDALLANAGHGLGQAFLDQQWDEIQHVIDTNVTGTIYLIHRVGKQMQARGRGRILITGSIAGYMPGSFQAVYNATKAFVDSFSFALRNELKDTGVTVTCLMPGATDTDFFARADMLDTKIGSDDKADPADVAKTGFEAMEKGEPGVIAGVGNKLRSALSSLVPDTMLAEQHRKMAEPGTARN